MAKANHREAISAISNFYNLIAKLPHIDPAALVYPPPGSSSSSNGWPDINTKELRKRGKTDEVITLLRHLPYLRHPQDGDSGQKRWMIAPETIAIAYCDGEVYSAELDEIQPTPGHCIWLADAVSSKGSGGVALLLDTESNTITEYSVRSERTIGLPAEEYDSLPREDRWMAHLTWPIADFFRAWAQKYEKLEWMPAYHNEGAAGTVIWFINPPIFSNDDYDSGSDGGFDEFGSDESDYEYDSEDGDSDPYEWDSEYESEEEEDDDDENDNYELSGEESDAKIDSESETAHTEEGAVVNNDDRSKRDALTWLKYYDVDVQVRLDDGKFLDPMKTPREAVRDAHRIYKVNGWPGSFDRDECRSQLSELLDCIVKR